MKSKEEVEAILTVTTKQIEKINYMDLEKEQLQNLSNNEIDEIVALLEVDVIRIEKNLIMSIELYKQLGILKTKIDNFLKLKN